MLSALPMWSRPTPHDPYCASSVAMPDMRPSVDRLISVSEPKTLCVPARTHWVIAADIACAYDHRICGSKRTRLQRVRPRQDSNLRHPV